MYIIRVYNQSTRYLYSSTFQSTCTCIQVLMKIQYLYLYLYSSFFQVLVLVLEYFCAVLAPSLLSLLLWILLVIDVVVTSFCCISVLLSYHSLLSFLRCAFVQWCCCHLMQVFTIDVALGLCCCFSLYIVIVAVSYCCCCCCCFLLLL